MYFQNEKKEHDRKHTFNLSNEHPLIDEDEEKKKPNPASPIIDNVALYPIEPALQKPAPEKFTPETATELEPEELANTPEGRFKLTVRLAAMKQAAPEGTEIGVRINPKSGNPEFYARGENLDYLDFYKKMDELMSEKSIRTQAETITKEDYINAKTHLSSFEQSNLIDNANSALKTIENLSPKENSRAAIQEYIQKQTNIQQKLSTKEQDVKDIKNTLANAGLTEIPLNQAVVTSLNNKEVNTCLKL